MASIMWRMSVKWKLKKLKQEAFRAVVIGLSLDEDFDLRPPNIVDITSTDDAIIVTSQQEFVYNPKGEKK